MKIESEKKREVKSTRRNACWKTSSPSRVLALLLLPVWLCAHPSAARAATPVSGVIAGETWTSANSPYVVVGNIQVAALTIQPGVTVEFANNYVFEVFGVLSAVGTTTNLILFTCTNAAVGWQGIFFNNGNAGSELGFCRIERSKNSGVRISNTTLSIHDCEITNNSGLPGGGLRRTGSGGLVLNNCVVRNNTTSGYQARGGGIFSETAITLKFCTISNNSVNAAGTSDYTSYAVGGGVFCLGNVVLQDCLVDHNIATYSYIGWTPSTSGGGVCSDGTVYATNSIFSNNECNSDVTSGPSNAGATGGGIWAQNVRMQCCIVTNNVAWADNVNGDRRWPSLAYGGGIYVDGSATELVNCLIARNSSATTLSADVRQGGGVYIAQGRGVKVINCTVVYNNGDGLRAASGALSQNRNSIFWWNEQSQIAGEAASAFCDIQNTTPDASGNIGANPVFLDPAQFTLFAGSPCVDAGDPNSIYNDASFPPSLGTARNDMGKDGGPRACLWKECVAPTIAGQSRGLSSCLGQGITFCVTPAGTPPLAYQWWFNGSPLSGQTSNCLVLGNLQSSNAGPYAVVVSSSCGSVTSAPIQLVVNDACVDICMYAGLTISGLPGRTYELRYTTDLSNTNFPTWPLLGTNRTPWFYIDTNSCGLPKRFYGVRLIP